MYKHSIQVQDKNFTDTNFMKSKWFSKMGHVEATG